VKKIALVIIPILVSLTGCATGNSYMANRSTTIEMYHIFDIKTKASTNIVTKAIADGLTQNTNDLNQVSPLQMGKLIPDTPGRFIIEDVAANFGGTGIGGMMQLASMQNGGVTMKAAKCTDAVWTSRAQRSIAGSSNLTLYSCLYKYKVGYQLNTYAVFQKTEGGIYQISRDLANSIVGTPEQWVNKTILDTVNSIEKATSTKVVHVEGQPELTELPTGVLFSNK
jgi:hypothetical protein